MQGRVGAAAQSLGRVLPGGVVRNLVAGALGDAHVSLCLHRVLETRRATDWQPSLTIPPAELDALITLLRSTRRAGPSPWLTVSFDDGYADAARYIASRADRFPDVEFLFFVCPQKLESRAGFRWDLAERTVTQGHVDTVFAPMDVRAENDRPELRALGAADDFELASLEACRRLLEKPNVLLGNHTNTHHPQTRLTPAQVDAEYAQSTKDFTRLFGPQRHFAFPFGDYATRHVSALHALGDFILWSTEPRPYASHERVRNAVLPRFSIDGRMPHRAIALWIAARALVTKLKGPRPLHWNEEPHLMP